MVALERVQEYSILPAEAPEFIEPRPDPAWPSEGKVEVEDLVIQYAVCPRPFYFIAFTRPTPAN